MKRTRISKAKAFTLIELLVVILILAILAAMIVPRIVSRTGDAKAARALSDISSLGSMLETYRLDCGNYPSTEEGLQALREQPADATGWNGPYSTKELPPDPWGSEYVYTNNGDDSYTILSYGADKAEGGEGENADIY